MQTAPDQDGATAADDRDRQIRELQATIVAMREELELKDHEARERVQAAVAGAAGEAEQLKATIIALREELESKQQTHLAEMQQQKQETADEVRQLRGTIQAMRDKLEGKGG